MARQQRQIEVDTTPAKRFQIWVDSSCIYIGTYRETIEEMHKLHNRNPQTQYRMRCISKHQYSNCHTTN